VAESGHTILAGKRIVVTRSAAQALDLLKALQHTGAIPILLPLIRILPADDFSPLDDALRHLSEFDLTIFTSQNAVRILRERADLLKISLGENHRAPLAAAVGEATAAEATTAGFQVIHIASRPVGIALVEDMGSRLRGKNVLLPRSDRANPDVLSALEKYGARTTEVIAYRTLAEDPQNSDVVSKAMNADAVLFFSPSAVEGFDSVCGPGKLAEFAAKGIVLASGLVTLAALHSSGIANATAASEPSVASILEALANSFRARNRRLSSEASTA
jgi:uroporphyrinogen-III synthase